MATYIVGTQKTRLNEVSILFSKLRSGQVSLIYFAQAVRIIYAEDRAQMNREFNYLFNSKWNIGFLARRVGNGSTMRS